MQVRAGSAATRSSMPQPGHARRRAPRCRLAASVGSRVGLEGYDDPAAGRARDPQDPALPARRRRLMIGAPLGTSLATVPAVGAPQQASNATTSAEVARENGLPRRISTSGVLIDSGGAADGVANKDDPAARAASEDALRRTRRFRSELGEVPTAVRRRSVHLPRLGSRMRSRQPPNVRRRGGRVRRRPAGTRTAGRGPATVHVSPYFRRGR